MVVGCAMAAWRIEGNAALRNKRMMLGLRMGTQIYKEYRRRSCNKNQMLAETKKQSPTVACLRARFARTLSSRLPYGVA